MTTVNGKLIGPAAPQRVEMQAALVDVTGKPAVGYVASVPGEVVQAKPISPGSDGVWTVDLTPNSEIVSDAGDTLWAITEGRTLSGTPIVSYVVVPDTGTHWVGGIRADLSDTQTGQGTIVYLPGPEGPAGDTGPAGADGQDGASAYQVAVAAGFTGTDTEWLASLEGAQGDPGPEGPQPELGEAGAGDDVALRSTDPTTTNARTPTAHATSHGSAGTDPVTVDHTQVSGLAETLDQRLPTTGGTLTGNLTLDSTFDGGGNTSDSTRRLQLETYQRAVFPNHFGEPIRIDLKRDDAKGMIAWREDYTGNGPRSVAWIGAHGKSNDGASWHNHISIEVPDLAGALQTALEVPFAPFNTANGFGISATDVYVRAVAKLIAGGVPLIVEGSPATSRDLNWGSTDGTNIGGKDAYRRWTARVDSTAEAGSNAGSDWRLVRYTDLGAAIDSPIFVKRSNGFVGIGGVTNPQVALDVGPGTGTVEQRLNRGTTGQFASQSWATAGTASWVAGLRNDSTSDWHLRDALNGRTLIKARQSGAAEFPSGLARGRTAVADANRTALATDSVIAYTSLTAARVVTLPNVGTASGQEFLIKDESGSCDGTKTITVAPASGTLDGAANKVINTAYGALRVYSNGTNWFTC